MPDSPLCERKTLVATMDSLDVGIIFVNNDNDIIFINKAAENIRKMKSEERIGTSILDCHGGKIKDRVLEVMNEFRTNPHATRHRIIKTSGRYFDNTYNVVKDNENYLGVVLLSQDITEKKELEDKLKKYNEELEMKVKERTVEIEKAYEQIKIAQTQLIQSEKMAAIGQFVSGLAHEINSPLDGIQNCLQVILNDLDNREQTQKYAELSLESTYKIEMLVRKLLSYARSHKLTMSDVDINFILKDILSLTSLKLSKNHVRLVTKLAEEIPLIYGDAHYLEQVFVNLILNASDAMPDGGELTVSTGLSEEGSVEIKVADTGTGIPQKNMDKIFDPFFTTKQKHNGTGLGLYLAYSFVTQHNGEISVKSNEGKGTEFRVKLPLKPLKVSEVLEEHLESVLQ
ncbi:MAG: PAS domain S-box protein [Ignavibacteriales bacterium]|jgi:PAS domain S-box-containing protein|nr:ATP-binding protein [Ignavibacteriaceae bacterium]NLH61837.1 PAS domain S-box protein [Ignavibacteriales bacterium]HOJ17958.1 ATP-binding protein [Ignavibacteriaceae bacterium]